MTDKQQKPERSKWRARQERIKAEKEHLASVILILDYLRETYPRWKTATAQQAQDVLLVAAYRLSQVLKERRGHG